MLRTVYKSQVFVLHKTGSTSLHSITKEIDDRLPAVTQGHPMEGGRSALRPFLVIGDLFAPL